MNDNAVNQIMRELMANGALNALDDVSSASLSTTFNHILGLLVVAYGTMLVVRYRSHEEGESKKVRSREELIEILRGLVWVLFGQGIYHFGFIFFTIVSIIYIGLYFIPGNISLAIRKFRL